MADRKKYKLLKIKLEASFTLPYRLRPKGIAPIEETRAWILIFNVPVLIDIDSNGKEYRTVYAAKGIQKIMEESSSATPSVSYLDQAKEKELEGHRVIPGLNGDCFVNITVKNKQMIKHVSQSGKISPVVSGLDETPLDGIAFLPEARKSWRVLFSYRRRGIHSVNFPRTFWSRLFSSPTPVLFSKDALPLCIATDKFAELLSVGDIRKRFIILDRDGLKVSEYVPKTGDFSPENIAFDHTGCVIVLDDNTSAITRISPDGSLLQTLLPEIDPDSHICKFCRDLLSPVPECRECKDKIKIFCIAVKEDVLWVGRFSGEIELYRLVMA